MNRDEILSYEILSKHCSTLKACSESDSGLAMTDSALEAVYFDAVVKEYRKRADKSAEKPPSNDALFIDESGSMTFIEFKSGTLSKSEIEDSWKQIELKLTYSLLVLSDIIDQSLRFIKRNVSYILVYNSHKNPYLQHSEHYDGIKQNVGTQAKEELLVHSSFKKYKIFLKEIHTYTEKEFADRFVRRYAHI